jgi:hypothetical protein
MTGKEHARLLGLFFWLLTGFQVFLIGFVAIIYFFIFGAVMMNAPHKASDPPPELIFGIMVGVMIFLLVITALFSIPKVVAGFGLRKERPWAKGWAIVACIMALLSAPFGTAVGVYGLWFIFGESGKAYFDGPGYGRVGPAGNVSAPPPNSWQ